jgi:hypothetical protein
MKTRRWYWMVGCLMAGSMTLLGCGDNVEEEPEPEADAGVPDGGGPAACPEPEELWADIDIAAFTPLAAIDELDIAADVMLPDAPDYWELRMTTPEGAGMFEVVLAAGEKCAGAADVAACQMAFDALTAAEGFGPGCEPDECHHYVVVNRGETNEVIADYGDLVTFLGSIDTPTEAALLAHAEGYAWDADEPAAGSIRSVDATGYELLVTELTEYCEPVVTERVQIMVSSMGEINDTRRQVFTAECTACLEPSM